MLKEHSNNDSSPHQPLDRRPETTLQKYSPNAPRSNFCEESPCAHRQSRTKLGRGCPHNGKITPKLPGVGQFDEMWPRSGRIRRPTSGTNSENAPGTIFRFILEFCLGICPEARVAISVVCGSVSSISSPPMPPSRGHMFDRSVRFQSLGCCPQAAHHKIGLKIDSQSTPGGSPFPKTAHPLPAILLRGRPARASWMFAVWGVEGGSRKKNVGPKRGHSGFPNTLHIWPEPC